jgi:hypothetical protein
MQKIIWSKCHEISNSGRGSNHTGEGGHYGHISLIKRINGIFGNMKKQKKKC